MRADRLLKLADYLDNKVPSSRWDYENYGYPLNCGTVGCAVGHCVDAFPDQWSWIHISEWSPRLIENSSRLTGQDVRKFFEIDEYDYGFLFEPYNRQNPLSPKATQKVVAAHIRKYVADKQVESCPMCNGKGKVQITEEVSHESRQTVKVS